MLHFVNVKGPQIQVLKEEEEAVDDFDSRFSADSHLRCGHKPQNVEYLMILLPKIRGKKLKLQSFVTKYDESMSGFLGYLAVFAIISKVYAQPANYSSFSRLYCS